MQLSALFRRGAVTPIDPRYLEYFRGGHVPADAPVAYAEIPSDSEFDELWNKSFFSDVNAAADVILDDFEEEEIPREMVETLERVVRRHIRSAAYSASSRAFLISLLDVCKTAAVNEAPIFFVL